MAYSKSQFLGTALPLFLAVSGFASSRLTADQAKILETVQSSALQYTQQLPDFICIQVTHREVSGLNANNTLADPLAGIAGVSGSAGTPVSPMSTMGAGSSANEIEERLTFFQQKESYEVIAVDGKKSTGAQHMDFLGAISAGEFGSALHNIFDPRSNTVFAWNHMEKLHGRRVYVFGFRVPAQSGITVFHKESGKQIVAAYAGKVFVDASGMDILRISFTADLPLGFPIRSNESRVDYQPTDIAGKKYMLPFSSEILMTDSTRRYVNRIEFKNYQKFTVQSTIHYNGGDSR